MGEQVLTKAYRAVTRAPTPREPIRFRVTQRRMRRNRPILAAAIGFMIPLSGTCGESSPAAQAASGGVRFATFLSVPPVVDPGRMAGRFAALTVGLTISSHAKESDFYGAVPVTLEPFSARDGAPERRVWSESTCHRDRGLPKIAFAWVDGAFILGDTVEPIHAVPRAIGLRLPADELFVDQSLLAPSSPAPEPEREYRLRAHTRASGVTIEVRLVKMLCSF
jgi:hypothetical protein